MNPVVYNMSQEPCKSYLENHAQTQLKMYFLKFIVKHTNYRNHLKISFLKIDSFLKHLEIFNYRIKPIND